MLSFATLTDEELRQTVRQLAVKDRAQLLELAEHLSEVEERRLHLKWGFSSLWDYCDRELALKDGSAHLRITLARLLRKKPVLKPLLLNGSLGLCTACELWAHIAAPDFDQLVTTATGMSKRAFKDLLDQRREGSAPRRDVIRRLSSHSAATLPHPVSAPKLAGTDEPAVVRAAVESALPSKPADSGLPATVETPSTTPAASSAAVKEGETRHRITFTATDEELAMLKRLQALLGSREIGPASGRPAALYSRRKTRANAPSAGGGAGQSKRKRPRHPPAPPCNQSPNQIRGTQYAPAARLPKSPISYSSGTASSAASSQATAPAARAGGISK